MDIATESALKLTIGLFGTCGQSRWREAFVSRYQSLGIPFFNPQVTDWKPEQTVLEAQHLAHDGIILLPVTPESYGTGSLAEVGFAVLSAIRNNQYIVIWVAQALDEPLIQHNALAAKESLRARALVAAHLRQHRHPNVLLVQDLEQMLAISLELHRGLRVLAYAHETQSTQ